MVRQGVPGIVIREDALDVMAVQGVAKLVSILSCGSYHNAELPIVNECLCLHAEENALLEAGRERIGDDSVIYCNT